MAKEGRGEEEKVGSYAMWTSVGRAFWTKSTRAEALGLSTLAQPSSSRKAAITKYPMGMEKKAGAKSQRDWGGYSKNLDLYPK